MSVILPIKYPLNYALGNNKAQGFPRVQYAKITEMIDAINAIGAGTITITDIELGDGTVALPSLTFASDLDSGLYRIGANNIGLTLAGTKSVDFGVNLTAFTGAITASTSISAGTVFLGAAGVVGAPEYSFTAQTDMGLYKVSATQLGVAISGALVGGFNASGLFTGFITEQTSGSGITFSKNIIRQNTGTAINSTGTATAAILNKGLITSTSGAATTITLDTAANIASQIGAVQGTVLDFIVDNTAGSNTVTVAVASGIVAAKQVSSGDTANDVLLTVAASATVGIGVFRLVFSSASAAVLFRIG